MLMEQRHKSILELLAREGAVSVRDLRAILKVSPETVRRDISFLAQSQQLKRTHGGAIAVDSQEPEIRERLGTNPAEKQAIGRTAASLVPDGAVVILDCGSTVQAVAHALAAKESLTVITNDLTICGILARRNGNRVHLLGGMIQEHEDATIGPDAVAMLEQYRADYAFIGAGAITQEPWLMDYSREASALRQMMLGAARATVVVADHSKFECLAPVRVDDFGRVTHLISDSGLSAGDRQLFDGTPVTLLIAEP
jgi:DeoR family glycerol-3-phosphate regulon repressor